MTCRPVRSGARAVASGMIVTVIAISVAGGCSRRPPPQPPLDAELSRASANARLAFDRGLLPQAVTLYAQALRRAEATDDARAISDASYNLAACLVA